MLRDLPRGWTPPAYTVVAHGGACGAVALLDAAKLASWVALGGVPAAEDIDRTMWIATAGRRDGSAPWGRTRSWHATGDIRDMLVEASLPIKVFLDDVKRRKPQRVSGTAVFMTSDLTGAPVVLLHHLKHNKVLHEQVLLLSIITADVPEVPSAERTTVEPLGEGFYRVIARYGFMQSPHVKEIMRTCDQWGLKLRPGDTTYYLGRERLIPTGRSRMAAWRKKLFVIMSRNARSATEFFSIPPNRVVELGAQIEL